jgi:cell division transport system permease protein
MAARPAYLIKESFSNLRRNVLMTATAILTITVSLTIVGAALLLRQGMNNVSVQFSNEVQLSVYMTPEATAAQIAAVRSDIDELQRNKQIARYRYLDQTESLAEFKKIFQNDPELRDSLTKPEDITSVFRLVPAKAERLSLLEDKFRNREGVHSVTGDEDIKALLRITRGIQVVLLSVAVALLLAAVLLILNTIQLAIFSRRREVAVMKLVGGTNWFIRLPFMLEGLFQGLIGALIAFGALYVGVDRLQTAIRNSPSNLFKAFSVSGPQVLSVGLFMMVVGAAVGAIGSAIAVSRFLDV